MFYNLRCKFIVCLARLLRVDLESLCWSSNKESLLEEYGIEVNPYFIKNPKETIVEDINIEDIFIKKK